MLNRSEYKFTEHASAISDSHDRVKDSKERSEAAVGFKDLSEQVKQQRKHQRESGKSGITGAGDRHGKFAPAAELLCKGAEGSSQLDNRHSDNKTQRQKEASLNSQLPKNQVSDANALPQVSLSVKAELINHEPCYQKAGEVDVATLRNSKSERLAKIDTATNTLIDGAERRFGKESIAELKIAKGDLGAATSALLLGPDLCKFIGADNASLLGKQLIVFGIAPMFGAADEAHKQMTKNTAQTVHEGSSNFLAGTAIGVVLEKAHPALLASALLGGIGLLANDQLNSPEHKVRNAKLADMNDKLKNCSNDELLNFADKSKAMLGPDCYKGAFALATGGVGIPEGSTLGAAIKDETGACLKQINVTSIAKSLKTLGDECWDAFAVVANGGGQRKLAFAGVPNDGLLAMTAKEGADAESRILKTTGATPGGRSFETPFSKLAVDIDKLAKTPVLENLEGLSQINKELLDMRSNMQVQKFEQAEALARVEKKFEKQLGDLRNEVEKLKSEAKRIELKPDAHRTAEEEKFLEKYYAAEDTLYDVLKEKLVKQYGWDGRGSGLDRSISKRSGGGTQREVSNSLKSLFDKGLEKNPYFQAALKANGVDPERAKDWISLPMPGENAADMAGCDLLLVNKSTGEMYPIDVTEKTLGLRNGKLVDSRVINSGLEFPDKNVPLERKNLVIGVADDVTRDNLNSRLRLANPSLTRQEAAKMLDLQRENELAEIIAKTISTKSKLNILETPLPSSDTSRDPSVMAYELWRFGHELEKLGYDNWKRVIDSSIRSLRTKFHGQGIPNYQGR